MGTKTLPRPTPVAVDIVNGGIGINWVGMSLQGPEFMRFLHELLRHAGFRLPQTVFFERNKIDPASGQARINWARLRISSEECQVNGVNPNDAVLFIRGFLSSAEVQQDFGATFEVA